MTADPTSTPDRYAHYERGRELFAEGDHLGAARELEELFTEVAGASSAGADPVGHGLADARLLLARAYFHSAQLRRAEGAARAVLEESPDDAYAHLLLGRTLQRAGRGDEARQHLRLAQLLGGYGSEAGVEPDSAKPPS